MMPHRKGRKNIRLEGGSREPPDDVIENDHARDGVVARPPLPLLFNAQAADSATKLVARAAARARAAEHAPPPDTRRWSHVRAYDSQASWDAQIDELYDEVHAALRWLLLGPDAALHAAAQHIVVELFGNGWRLPRRR